MNKNIEEIIFFLTRKSSAAFDKNYKQCTDHSRRHPRRKVQEKESPPSKTGLQHITSELQNETTKWKEMRMQGKTGKDLQKKKKKEGFQVTLSAMGMSTGKRFPATSLNSDFMGCHFCKIEEVIFRSVCV